LSFARNPLRPMTPPKGVVP